MTEAIKGLDKILAKLRKLDSTHNIAIHKAAARAGAVALKKGSEGRLSPKHRNKLGVAQSRTFSIGDLIVYKVGPYKQHWALAFQEFGAPGHYIEPIKKGKRLRGEPKRALALGLGHADQTGSVNLVGGKVWHPGVRRNKFLSRALTEDSQKAFDAMGKRYWQRINKLL